MDEKKIMGFLTSEYSWEQIIYEIVAWDGMNPWDLDISKLADYFVEYVRSMDTLDFRVPAKYIIVAAMLLKMKSDYLQSFKEQITGQEEQEIQEELKDLEEESGNFQIDPLNIPPRRQPTRRIVISELVNALRKVLKAEDRRTTREKERRDKIVISADNINERIKTLYSKINTILGRIRNKEIEFSHLVDKWEKEDILNNFVPLIHLDNQGKVSARQEKVFEEIYVSRGKK
ncbi:MAG: segregation/condensation protein A [Candidatus Aenigmarchaeota archaeon]|nr:segregation/condensation protein A [Candidatus Aenigmarchaeota archaeon]